MIGKFNCAEFWLVTSVWAHFICPTVSCTKTVLLLFTFIGRTMLSFICLSRRNNGALEPGRKPDSLMDTFRYLFLLTEFQVSSLILGWHLNFSQCVCLIEIRAMNRPFSKFVIVNAVGAMTHLSIPWDETRHVEPGNCIFLTLLCWMVIGELFPSRFCWNHDVWFIAEYKCASIVIQMF